VYRPEIRSVSLRADLTAFVCDVIVAAILYELFQPVNGILSLLAASFRLVHVAVMAVNSSTISRRSFSPGPISCRHSRLCSCGCTRWATTSHWSFSDVIAF
jgi:Domain of unknown function (DUF4386)